MNEYFPLADILCDAEERGKSPELEEAIERARNNIERAVQAKTGRLRVLKRSIKVRREPLIAA